MKLTLLGENEQIERVFADSLPMQDLLAQHGSGDLFGTFSLEAGRTEGVLTRDRGTFVFDEHELRAVRGDGVVLSAAATLGGLWNLTAHPELLGFHGGLKLDLECVGYGGYRCPAVFDQRACRGVRGLIRLLDEGPEGALAAATVLMDADNAALVALAVLERLDLSRDVHAEFANDLKRMVLRRGDAGESFQGLAAEVGLYGFDAAFEHATKCLEEAGWGRAGRAQHAPRLLCRGHARLLALSTPKFFEGARAWWQSFDPALATTLVNTTQSLSAEDLCFAFVTMYTWGTPEALRRRRTQLESTPLYAMFALLWPLMLHAAPHLFASENVSLSRIADALIVRRLPPIQSERDGKPVQISLEAHAEWKNIIQLRAASKHFDPEAIAQAIEEALRGETAQYNLPRAFELLASNNRLRAVRLVEEFGAEVLAESLRDEGFTALFVAVPEPTLSTDILRHWMVEFLKAKSIITEAHLGLAQRSKKSSEILEGLIAPEENRLFLLWEERDKRDGADAPRALQARLDALEGAVKCGVPLHAEHERLRRRVEAQEKRSEKRAVRRM